MAHKTRREKIRAAYRKQARLIHDGIEETKRIDKHETKAISKEEITKDLSHKNYFVKDLKKSLFFILLIIGIELALYLTSSQWMKLL